MCGIVAYLGPQNGVQRVLAALELLAYRAPDASGVAVLADNGRFEIRRVVGDSQRLQAELAQNPLPPAASPIVVGHGRWAMVGVNSVTNAHPLTDRSQSRLVVENGSHNASLMLKARTAQEVWWRQRGLLPTEPVHRSLNTTEVIAYEWECLARQLAANEAPAGTLPFLARLDRQAITDPEERALRLALWRLREGNGHACALYSSQRPFTLYVSSHHKPIILATRRDTGEMMIASDVNAALALWPQTGLETAVQPFPVSVIYLDHNLHGGTELLAKISLNPADPDLAPTVSLSRYDGRPVTALPQPVNLSPDLVGKQGYPSYTEYHMAEIPAVLDGLAGHYWPDDRLQLESVWRDGHLFAPGLNQGRLTERFGPRLAGLHRLHLVGEGSSWRDAQCAALLLRQLLPDVTVIVSRPVAMLNLGTAVNPQHDLALLISWSGTTDALLKVDGWLADEGLLRLSITGRPQNDLGRRTALSGGTLNVYTGSEVAVATTKGFVALLFSLNLLALHLATLRDRLGPDWHHYHTDLRHTIPTLARHLLQDEAWRTAIRAAAHRCRRFNKVAVVGISPIDVEGELKIEELAQIVAIALAPQDSSLRTLIEQTAQAPKDEQRTLFVLNGSTPAAAAAVAPVLAYLQELAVMTLVLCPVNSEQGTGSSETGCVGYFPIPTVTAACQPLLDALFFFELAVALAYARGLSPEAIDRPRNLAKSVTTTGAERHSEVSGRPLFPPLALADFAPTRATTATTATTATLSPAATATPATSVLRLALATRRQPLPEWPDLDQANQLLLLTDAADIENGAKMAQMTWQQLPGLDLVVYRRFGVAPVANDTPTLRLTRSGGLLVHHRDGRITLPVDLPPLQIELLTAVYLMNLAVRLAQERGLAVASWQSALTRLPHLLADLAANRQLANQITAALTPFWQQGYDKWQIIGGGQDYVAAHSIARSLRQRGIMAEALYTDSAWHGPLAAVGGPGATQDALVLILATDPLFQATALVDTQVYRVRQAPVFLIVPQGHETDEAVLGVDALAVWGVTDVPPPFIPLVGAVLGQLLAGQHH